MSLRLSVRTACTALVAGALAACSGSTTPSTGSTELRVLLKDAPGDFAKAVVTISEVYLVGAEGRLTLTSTPVTTDLLTLASSTADLVDGVDIPSGTYSEMRFVISGACIAVEQAAGADAVYATQGYDASLCGTGPVGRLQAPSLGQSGLKVKFDAPLEIEGNRQVVVADFDVRQSFGRQAGNSGMWVLSPVIKGAFVEVTGSALVNVSLAQGVTLPTVGETPVTLGDFSAVLLDAANDTAAVVKLADTDGDATFSADFIYVAPGAYTVGLKLPAALSAITSTPALPAPLSVQASQDASLNISVTGVTVAPPPAN